MQQTRQQLLGLELVGLNTQSLNKFMMPLSHVYVSTQVTGRKNPLLIFGSVLPDISFAPNAVIKRSELHDNPVKFLEFVKSHYPELSDLAVGVRLHSGIDKGADFYSDDAETGFALREGKKIIDEVALMLETEADTSALILSHNFIEAGVDLNLAKQDPDLVSQFLSVPEQLDISLISKCLGEYLHIEKNIIEEQLVKFIPFILGVGETTKMADRIFSPLIQIRYNKTAPVAEISKIIDHSIELTSDSYSKWLQEAIVNMKNNFAGM
jgi:hypothetical protein